MQANYGILAYNGDGTCQQVAAVEYTDKRGFRQTAVFASSTLAREFYGRQPKSAEARCLSLRLHGAVGPLPLIVTDNAKYQVKGS